MEDRVVSLANASKRAGLPLERLRRAILLGELVAEPVPDDREYLRDGHTFQVVMVDNKKERKGGIPGFPDRVRVSISEVDDHTKKILRSIPVQEFEGEHEQQGPRALILKGGKIRFWMQFWV